jgi:translocation and assembly module TamA
MVLLASPADAVDVLKPETTAPLINQETALKRLRYQVSFTSIDKTAKLTEQLTEASSLAALAQDGAADMGQLLARARSDQKLLKAVLFEAGHYAGTITIEIAGKNLDAAQALPVDVSPTATVPVSIHVAPGPIFRFGTLDLVVTSATTVAPPMDPAAYGLVPGEVARSRSIVRAVHKIVEEWRIAGYPFARVANKKISADHATNKLDARIEIDPGKPAVYGWLNVAGTSQLSPGMVARYSGLRPGQSYNPKDLKNAGDRLRKLEAVESVRINHGEALDSGGGIPITLEVTERKRRFIGATASVSTVDGGEVQAYWGHRNLFGRAERLKVEGGLSQIGNSDDMRDLQYMTRTTLTVPGVLDIDTDLFSEFHAAKERPESYESRYVRLKVGLKRVFNERVSGDVAFAAAVSEDEDVFGESRHSLISLPAKLVSDTRDNKLDPTTGWRLSFGAEPAYNFHDNTSFLIGRGQASVYKSIDASDHFVVAGRVGAASIIGSTTENIPASMRLYGGGSGSVRGFAYRSLGPRLNGEVVGGRSLLEGSAELRWRATKDIGLVAFLDAASVSAEYLPELDDIQTGAGVGLRYYTSLGPIRLDVAWPLTDNSDLADVAMYVGIGQAF